MKQTIGVGADRLNEDLVKQRQRFNQLFGYPNSHPAGFALFKSKDGINLKVHHKRLPGFKQNQLAIGQTSFRRENDFVVITALNFEEMFRAVERLVDY